MTRLPKMPSPEEIERIKQLRDAGAPAPAPRQREEQRTQGLSPLKVYLAKKAIRDVAQSLDRPAGERLNGREQQALYALGGANELLFDNVPAGLEGRMRKLRLWWRFKGAAKILANIQEQVQNSAEEAQIRTIRMRSQHLNVHIGMDSVKDPDGTWVRICDLNTVLRYLLEDTCGLCVRDSAEADRCPLRQALRAMTTISDREISRAKNGCIYKSLTLWDEFGMDEEAPE